MMVVEDQEAVETLSVEDVVWPVCSVPLVDETLATVESVCEATEELTTVPEPVAVVAESLELVIAVEPVAVDDTANRAA